MTTTAKPGARTRVGIRVAVAAVIVVAFLVVEELRDQIPRNLESWIRIGILVIAWLAFTRLVLPRLVKNQLARTAVTVVPVLVFAWLFLSPAFRDKMVVEALPGVVPAAAAAGGDNAAPSVSSGPSATAATAPVKVSTGMFKGIDHSAKGEVSVYRLADGKHIVRFEDIDIQNGPDLYVYLAPKPGQENDDGAVNLGRLKGNQGSQNYEIPTDVDLAAFKTVLVWCRAFAVPFANATQTAV